MQRHQRQMSLKIESLAGFFNEGVKRNLRLDNKIMNNAVEVEQSGTMLNILTSL